MTTLRHRLTGAGNRIGAWTYRAFGGRLSSPPGVPVLMITSPGRRTGLPRSTCVRYLDADEGYLVWGTASGAPRDPDWFRNLRAAAECDVQIRRERFRATRRELTGEERDRVWTGVVLVRAPAVARYERKAGRTIPVALLTRVDPD